MIYGVIGLFVVTSVMGIIGLTQNFFDIKSNDALAPGKINLSL